MRDEVRVRLPESNRSLPQSIRRARAESEPDSAARGAGCDRVQRLQLQQRHTAPPFAGVRDRIAGRHAFLEKTNERARCSGRQRRRATLPSCSRPAGRHRPLFQQLPRYLWAGRAPGVAGCEYLNTSSTLEKSAGACRIARGRSVVGTWAPASASGPEQPRLGDSHGKRHTFQRHL